MLKNDTLNTGQIGFSQKQIDHLASLHFINPIDQHLRIISSIKIISDKIITSPRIILELEIYYDNHHTGDLSFNLHNYEYEDIITIVQNIRGNEYILHEVDNFLSGDVVE